MLQKILGLLGEEQWAVLTCCIGVLAGGGFLVYNGEFFGSFLLILGMMGCLLVAASRMRGNKL
jgi:hypothetical protein